MNTAFRSFRLRKFSRFTLKGSKAVRTLNRSLKRNCTTVMCSIAIPAVQRLLQHHQQRQQPAFYCHNPVVLKGRLSGDFKPDRIIPFKLSREQAVSAFMDKTKGKKFLPKDFLSNSNIEKMTGVYFPYWYIDTQQDSHMTAKGKKYKHWKSGDRRYTETSYYDLF